MMGKLSDRDERGIIPRLCEDMFWRMRNLQVSCPSSAVVPLQLSLRVKFSGEETTGSTWHAHMGAGLHSGGVGGK